MKNIIIIIIIIINKLTGFQGTRGFITAIR